MDQIPKSKIIEELEILKTKRDQLLAEKTAQGTVKPETPPKTGYVKVPQPDGGIKTFFPNGNKEYHDKDGRLSGREFSNGNREDYTKEGKAPEVVQVDEQTRIKMEAVKRLRETIQKNEKILAEAARELLEITKRLE